MSYETYKILHLLGILLVFVALGGTALYAANGGNRSDNRYRGLVTALHGVGLLIVLVAGFGLHARLGIDGLPPWFIAKLGIWVLLGVIIIVPYRQRGLAAALLWALPLIGALAAWLAIAKPF